MRQYARFKEAHPDCVLFFRMGDFYEMFDDDARLCHRVLGITLTERSKGVPMAGVPYHAVDGYLRTMIQQGYRVAVCEQVEDPREAKGVVKRAVDRVVTPGTLIDENLLDAGAANRIAAVYFTEAGDDSSAVAAVIELSTGSFTLHDFHAHQLLDELARLAPSEVLYAETADGIPPPRAARIAQTVGCALTHRPVWHFRPQEAREVVLEHFRVKTFDGFGLSIDDRALQPAGALLRYLRETQCAQEHHDEDADAPPSIGALAHLQPPRRETHESFVALDAATLRSLEIERTLRSGSTDGSLLGAMKIPATPMGRRLIREWLCFPIRDRAAIEARQRCVLVLKEDSRLAKDVVEALKCVQDVARMAGRAATGRATPRDLAGLGSSLAASTQLLTVLEGCDAFAHVRKAMAEVCDVLQPLGERIEAACIDSPPAHLREGGLFADGLDAELDEARALQRDGNAWLAQYQAEQVSRTGIPSLKVRYNRVFGYSIEITHAHRSRVPDDYVRRQTMKNAERYITPELKDFEEKVTTAEARAIAREQQLFAAFISEVLTHVQAISRFAELVAQIDVLAAFAETALQHHYVQPIITDTPGIIIREGRHPVLDQFVGQSFVPNDCELGASGIASDTTPRTLALITGPNMAGKSTYIRQVALITLLAHAGSFVPAQHATIGLVDRIFTRIGAQDELHQGHSTFMVEMTETANILHHATHQSLVILDEIGRGTSTLDGLALAWAIAESLAVRGSLTLFATHYHELTRLADDFESVRNLHVSVREWGPDGKEEIIFIYRVEPGSTDRSYGIHVARIAGLPGETVARAQAILDDLSVQGNALRSPAAETGSAAGPDKNPRNSQQLSLFTEFIPHPAVEALREMKIDAMTPLQAFDQLRTLREQV
ncbi:MAG: DNA mismatch repair protein MutS [Phycisphaerales bacterium]